MDKKQRFRRRSTPTIWDFLRPIIIIIASLAIIIFMMITGYQFIMNNYLNPVDESNTQLMDIEIENGLGKNGVANVLYGENKKDRLIRSKIAFKIYVDFMGKARNIRAGSFKLSKSMTIPEIVNTLASGSGNTKKVIQFTLFEGMSVEDMANELTKSNVLEKKDEFLEICKQGEGFEGIQAIDLNDKRREYMLEGYLFPDTYKVYEGSSARTIIELMLMRFNEILSVEDMDRAEELNMTIHEIITLASMIEKEAKTVDFEKVSAVFHNRLEKDMPLESDVSIKYALRESKIYLSKEKLEKQSPYNTHINKGLPPGPICNPGKNAIKAALWPDENYRKEGFIFFTLLDPTKAELGFSKTYQEHLKMVEQHRDSWIAYDKQMAEKTRDDSSKIEANSADENKTKK